MNVAPWDEFSTVKMPAWTQKLDPDCISQILRIVCTLSSLEPLSFECEIHPLTGTLLEARIKLQRRLLTMLTMFLHKNNSEVVKFKMICLKSFKTAFMRQVNEGVRIENSKADICMNSKAEFHQPSIVRVSTVLGNHNDEQTGAGGAGRGWGS